MGKMKGDITKVYNVIIFYRKTTNWGVEYHQLILGKPEYIIIDDKSIFFKENWYEEILK